MINFLKYFKYYNFLILGSQNIVSKDKKLLFNNSGFSALKKLISKYKINISMFQNCLRMQGIYKDDNINNDSIHQIFFKMMCHFSFNSIFINIKKIFIYFYLLKLKFKYLYITINLKNYESVIILLLLKINNKKIIFTKKNIWKVNYNGYCGYSIEFYYKKNFVLLEIWNLVIINYLFKKNRLRKILTKIIDTGMGLIRLRKILKKKNNKINLKIFDIFQSIYIIYNTIKMNNNFINLLNKLIRMIFIISFKKKIKIYYFLNSFFKKKKFFDYNHNEKKFFNYMLQKEINLIKFLKTFKINCNINNFMFIFKTHGVSINYIYNLYCNNYK